MILQRTDPHLQQSLNRVESSQKQSSSFWKSLTLGVLTSFSALAFSYFYYQFISSSIEHSVLGSLGLMLLFGVLFLFQTIFINDFKTLSTFTLVESVLLWGIFIFETHFLSSLIGLGITFLMLYYALLSGRIYMEKLIRISFFRVGKVIMVSFMTGMALFIAMGYISIGLSGSTSIVSRTIFSNILSGSSSLVQGFFPGFSFEESLRDNIEILTLQRVKSDDQFNNLTIEQRQSFVTQTILEVENKASEFVGAPVDSRKKLSEVLYSLLSLKFNELTVSYGVTAYIIVVLVIAFILRGLAPFIYWPLLVFSFIVFQFLLAFGFVDLLLENHSKEILKL